MTPSYSIVHACVMVFILLSIIYKVCSAMGEIDIPSRAQ